jgi:putative endonuclease
MKLPGAHRQIVGNRGERLGEHYLQQQGYKIVERNVRSPFGEIDLVARHGQVLVFVEVKTRKNLAFGYPEEGVGKRKQERLIRLASWYLARKQIENEQIRFDVLSILLNEAKPNIRLIQNAFEA